MKYLLTILLFLFSITSFSQELKVIDGDTMVVLTLEQAQKVDSDLELLEIYKELNILYEGDTIYYQVINDLEETVANLELQIDKYENITDDQKTIISNLKSQIEEYEANEIDYKAIISNKDKIIEYKDKQIKKTRRRAIIGSVISALLGASTAILFL